MLMLPSTLIASYCFIFPISSAPNALVFDRAGLTLVEFAKVGLGATLISISVAAIYTETLGEIMFHFNEFPSWANTTEFNETSFTNFEHIN